jgi:hypothetical protein
LLTYEQRNGISGSKKDSYIFSVGKLQTNLQTAIFTAAALIASNIAITGVFETGTETNTNKFPVIEEANGVRNGL